MKNYSYLRTISYDVIIWMSYSQVYGSKLFVSRSLLLWGLGFETSKVFIISHLISE